MRTNIVGVRPPEHPTFPSHIQWTDSNRLLSPPEVAAVIEAGETAQLYPGTIGNGTEDQATRNDEYRCVDTGVINLSWLYERLIERVKWANDEHFRFHISGLSEPIGYLRYTAASEAQPVAGHYDWHQDFGGGLYSTRKLSIVVQLSDPSEYDGCRLVLCNDGPWEVPYVQPGDAIMFPSWTPHCVTDITRGVRRALVIWVAGPQFQ